MIILIPAIYALMGIAIYATLINLFVGLRKPMSVTYLLLACLTLNLFFLGLSQVYLFQSTQVDEYINVLRFNIIPEILSVYLLVWFIALRVNYLPRKFLFSLTILSIIVIFLNFVEPYSSFAQVTELKMLILPWGEKFSRVYGSKKYLTMLIGAITFYAGHGYLLKILIQKKYRQQISLTMQVALIFNLIMFQVAMLFRLLNIDLVSLVFFNNMIVVITMSIATTIETEQKLLKSENRFRALVEQSPFSIQILSAQGKILQVNQAWEKMWGSLYGIFPNNSFYEDKSLINPEFITHIDKAITGTASEIQPQLYEITDSRDKIIYQAWIKSYIYPIKNNLGTTTEVVLLHEDITKQQDAKNAIQMIASGIASKDGEDFFTHIVQSLTNIFGTDYALIGTVVGKDNQQIETLAICSHGQILSNISYDLKNTPCANVISKKTCIYREDLQTLFPKDQLLVDMGVDSCIGTPFFDYQGKVLGLIAVFHSQPLTNVDYIAEILEIFSIRVGGEVERLQNESKIRRMAYEDYLTKLPNRAYLHEYIKKHYTKRHFQELEVLSY